MNIRRGDIVGVTHKDGRTDPYVKHGELGTVVKTRFNPFMNYHIVIVKFSKKTVWGRTPFPCFLHEIKVIRRKNR